MARSAYIYIVLCAEHGPVASFTVKRELLHWLGRCKAQQRQAWTVTRMIDGTGYSTGKNYGNADVYYRDQTET